MREGSTLIHELLPDTEDCSFNQPLALSPMAPGGFILKCVVVIAMAFMLRPIVNVGILFVMLLAGGMTLDSSSNPGFNILLRFAYYGVFGPYVFALLGLLFTFRLSGQMARHWVYINAAEYCPPDEEIQVRKDFERNKFGSLILLPSTLFFGALKALLNLGQSFDAWISFLEYGTEGPQPPGTFHSPAGSRASRNGLFLFTGFLLAMSCIGRPDEMPLPLSIGVVHPALWLLDVVAIVILVPLFITANHFDAVRRMRNGTY